MFENFNFQGYNKADLVGYKWKCGAPKGVVLIIHGMSEHAARYDHFAGHLNSQGYTVYSSDLRGHGKTAGDLENVGLFSMSDGWHKVVQDQRALIQLIKEEHNLPLFVLGHSMGSFVTRSISFSGEDKVDGYILSATAGDPGLLGRAGKVVASLNKGIMGRKNRSKLLDNLAFGDFNKKYETKRTKKDWLSRDEKVVDDYINDPYCMQIFTAQFFSDLLEGILSINRYSSVQKMAKVPYYIFSGTMDPVGDWSKGTQKVFDLMKQVELNVELKFYEDGRHEMLNEVNKEEVYADVVNWIDKTI
ncbi:MAG: alpha-beta hydrolase superfamily lysophospholipase [Parvicellaceae bacterium]|jgi:alpha-beta hydrolase superfamily lysophospholipase